MIKRKRNVVKSRVLPKSLEGCDVMRYGVVSEVLNIRNFYTWIKIIPGCDQTLKVSYSSSIRRFVFFIVLLFFVSIRSLTRSLRSVFRCLLLRLLRSVLFNTLRNVLNVLYGTSSLRQEVIFWSRLKFRSRIVTI